MSDPNEQPRVRDPGAPATDAQRGALAHLGVDPSFVNDPRLTKGKASELIDEARAHRAGGQQHNLPQGEQDVHGFKPAFEIPHPQGATAAATPGPIAQPMPAAPPASVPAIVDDEDQGPLTPIASMRDEDRAKYGILENGTTVLQGTTWKIIPELGMPAKFVFARISVNRRTGLPDVRLFPSIEGLVFRANAYAKGIRSFRYEFIKEADIPGLAPFLEETKDPVLICQVHLTLGDGTEVVEQGTVRLSEIKLYQSRRTGKMVARSPVARSNPTELAIKRAVARALRWGTGFGGTALDELPLDESEGAREKAGLKGGSAALPAPKGGSG